MTLFEQIKSVPKVDMHINLTSSISTGLAYSLQDDLSMALIVDEMREKNSIVYQDALKMPVKILNNSQNVTAGINDLIDRLIKNNVIYGELFLDLPLYNQSINERKLLETVLKVIYERHINLQVVLVISSLKDKDSILKTLDLFEEYYEHGVNGIYFYKDKMANLSDYMYVFDRLIKNEYAYIVNINSKVASRDEEIYLHAKRVIYMQSIYDEVFINNCRKNNVMLEFSITRLIESNVISDLKEWFIYNLLKDNVTLTITSCDMTTLNTDIVNEWCLMFNNYPVTFHEMIKVLHNSLINANIDDKIKNNLIVELMNKANLIL